MGWSAEARAFHAKIDQKLKQLPADGPEAGYVVYVIKDPRDGDPCDWTDGTPFYVGQTHNLRRRAKQHLRDGGSAESIHPLHRRLYAILQSRRVPIFQVLYRTTTRLQALETERQWALKLMAEGHPLTNEWLEHRSPASSIYSDGTGVPTHRLWDFTLKDAKLSGLDLKIECPRCGLSEAFPVNSVIARSRPEIRLHQIREAIRCPRCSSTSCVEIAR